MTEAGLRSGCAAAEGRIRRPFDHRRSGRVAGAERHHQELVARGDAVLRQRLDQRHRDRCGARVPVALDVQVRLVRRNADRVLDALDDAQVGLVEEELVDVGDAEARVAQRRLGRLGQLPGRVLVDLLARHVHEVTSLGHGLGRGRAGRSAGREDDPLRAAAVAVHVEAHEAAGRIGGGHDHGARAVAEQDARVAVGVVEEPAQQLDADHEHVAVHAAAHVGRGGREREDEARAGGHEVEAGGPRCPELMGDEHGGGRHVVVGRAGADDHEVELGRVHARHGEGIPGGVARSGSTWSRRQRRSAARECRCG